MYVVVVYDVGQDRNRSVITFLRTHLNWVQNSVFEGEVTKAEMRDIKNTLSSNIEEGDSILVYEFRSEKYVNKTVLGEEKGTTDRVI